MLQKNPPTDMPFRGPTVGHVHIRVADLARAVTFYSDVIGLEVQAYYGEKAAFLSSNGYHHHIPSILGIASARHHQGTPGFTTPPFSTPTEQPWPWRCAESWPPA